MKNKKRCCLLQFIYLAQELFQNFEHNYDYVMVNNLNFLIILNKKIYKVGDLFFYPQKLITGCFISLFSITIFTIVVYAGLAAVVILYLINFF